MASSGASIQDSMSASGLASEKLSLLVLQSKMKSDPEGYTLELVLVYNQFKSSVELFEQQAALNFTSLSGIATDPMVAKDLGDRALFLAHITPFYPKQLLLFPKELAQFLKSSAQSLPSGLRFHVTQALILLSNRKLVDIVETLELFMELQSLGDRALRQLAFSHVIHSIKRMNQKHKNDPKNRALQNILFGMLQQEDEAIAKRALITLCDFHRRKVWFDDRTANAICVACFHVSSKIMIAALSFLLDFEKIGNDDDTNDSDNEDNLEIRQTQIVVNKESIYRAKHKGTTSSKKKKKAKLQRVIRSMKKQQRRSSENSNISNYFSPLNRLKDAQGFVEKLFSRLQTCNERFEVKMMMLKVISRTVGLHHLILLNFYPYLQKYIQPYQRDVTSLLAAAVQACHDMVPPDAVEPLFKQIVNQFVHDRSRTEAISVGLNVVREICLRMPLLMSEDLLQDLVLYKKSHEKAVSSAARSLVTLFREVCPSLLIKKDRGRPTHPKARPKAFGEVHVASNVPGVELLEHDDDGRSDDIDEDGGYSGLSDDDNENVDVGPIEEGDSQCESGGSSDDDFVTDGDSGEDDVQEDEEVSDSDDDNKAADQADDISDEYESDEELKEDSTSLLESDDGTVKDKKSKALYIYGSSDDDFVTDGDSDEDDVQEDEEVSDSDDDNKAADQADDISDEYESDEELKEDSTSLLESDDGTANDKKSKAKKRKFSDFDGQLNAASRSPRALKKLAGEKVGNAAKDTNDGILSNEDFQRIKELKTKEAKIALTQHGFKIPSSDQLSTKRIDAAELEANVRKKLTKEEKLALIRARREERGKYRSSTSIKQKKTGGTSNQQKEHKKAMPLAARRSKIAKARVEKKKKHQRSGNQFRGRKAWK